MPDENSAKPAYIAFFDSIFSVIERPVTAFRENVVEPMKPKERPVYYHQKYRRIPSIDECDIGDEVCFYEANEQFKRDRRVDSQVLDILRSRRQECEHYYGFDAEERCRKPKDDYITAETNWFIKYGDLGATGNVLDAYMKQKHRLLWERRHGPVGTGMNKQE